MSFENKGFPNDLNSRFSSMNRENVKNNGSSPQTIKGAVPVLMDHDFPGMAENLDSSTASGLMAMPGSPAWIKAQLNVANELKKKAEAKGEKKPGKFWDFLGALFKPKESTELTGNLPAINQPDFIKTNLDEVVITGSKGKKFNYEYIIYGVILIILIVLIVKAVKK